MDNNAPESEKPMRKPLSQTNLATEFQANNEAGVKGTVKMPKSSKKRQKKNGNSEKKGDSSSSPSSGRPECSSPTGSLSSDRPEYSRLAKVAEEYRALKRDYLLLQEECATLTDEGIEVERNIEILEAEKHALLDKLVVLEGLVQDSDSVENSDSESSVTV